jgi:Prolyl oligopeptidase family
VAALRLPTSLHVFFLLTLLTGGISPASAAEKDLAALFGTITSFGLASISPGGKVIGFDHAVEGAHSVVIIPLESDNKPSRHAFATSVPTRLDWRDDNFPIVTTRRPIRGLYANSPRGLNRDMVWDAYRGIVLSVQDASEANPGDAYKPVSNLGQPLAFESTLVEVNSRIPEALFFAEEMSYTGFIPRGGNLGGGRVLARPSHFLTVSPGQHRFAVAWKGTENDFREYRDGSGNIVARMDVSQLGEERVSVPTADGFKQIASFPASGGHVAGLTEDGKSLAVMMRRENGRLGLYRMDLADGKIGEPLFADAKSDIIGIVYDQRTAHVVGATYDDGNPRIVYFSPERQNAQKQAEAAFPGRKVEIVSSSADKSKSAVMISGPQHPPSLHLADLKASRVDIVTETYPQLRGTKLGEVRRYAYKSSDSAENVGRLILPPDAEPKNLPLVVLPPGGFGFSLGAFDWFAHFLAQRGYAVFQASAQNNKGWSDLSGMTSLGEWVRETHGGMESGVDSLIAQGIADAKRVCIAGANDNGYLALSSAMFAPGKYACVINFAGITNLRKVYEWGYYEEPTTILDLSRTAMLRHRVKYSLEELGRYSPALHAKSAQAPILLIFGDRDTLKDQGIEMRNALVSARKPVEYVTLQAENGSLSSSKSRIALLNAVDKFLAKHIGNGPRAQK